MLLKLNGMEKDFVIEALVVPQIYSPITNQIQFVIFNLPSYCFRGTIGFEVKASFASRPVSRLIR